MRGFQAAAVQTCAPAYTRRVSVMTEVIDMLTRFKRADGQREDQPVTQQRFTFMSDTAISRRHSDSALPNQATVFCAYATCMYALKGSHMGNRTTKIREYKQ